MRTLTAHTTARSTPNQVLQLLTDPDAIARWAPIPFEILELDRQRLARPTSKIPRTRRNTMNRVLLTDDQALLRAGFRVLLNPTRST